MRKAALIGFCFIILSGCAESTHYDIDVTCPASGGSSYAPDIKDNTLEAYTCNNPFYEVHCVTNTIQTMKGQNYHQWLTSQYGLKKLVEHIWVLIGIASTCDNIEQLRDRMAEKYGLHRVQLSLFVPAPKPTDKP